MHVDVFCTFHLVLIILGKIDVHFVAVRLVDGLNRCQGRLEIMLPTSDSFGQACDLDAGASEVEVVCRQLGCNPVGARRADPRT
jgi:hypothetical protein